MNCIYDLWDTNDRVPMCLAGYVECEGERCAMCHPIAESKIITLDVKSPEPDSNLIKLFKKIEPMVQKYDEPGPKIDELVFVKDVCNATGLSRRDAMWFIRTIRRGSRIVNRMSEVSKDV